MTTQQTYRKAAERHEDIETQVRQNLEELGIDSFDAMVNRLAATAPWITHEDEIAMIANAQGDDQQTPRPHTPPEMQVVIDGEVNEPEAVREFNGQALYSTPGLNGKGDEEVLYMFTSLEGLKDHMVRDHSVAARHADIGTSNPDSLSVDSHYYENDDLGGDWLQNGPGRGWSDLSKVHRGFLGLGNWDNIISSVDWCRWHITLFDGANWGGSRLELPAGRTRYHLRDFGWNDRTSATVNWGRRF
ncbi:hypothetical protein GT030_11220 [Streptomyces sp. SID1328]|uniref:hypothetical protein n=1 Tax=Streptomyces sp. SID1328 TaxID=2690250 RepID=UPI001369F266|nr:hypothetical protein [Streptomyces sp. SID1328]MYV39426.1 hypothetical protein [Streptomyces sp. SID1328]